MANSKLFKALAVLSTISLMIMAFNSFTNVETVVSGVATTEDTVIEDVSMIEQIASKPSKKTRYVAEYTAEDIAKGDIYLKNGKTKVTGLNGTVYTIQIDDLNVPAQAVFVKFYKGNELFYSMVGAKGTFYLEYDEFNDDMSSWTEIGVHTFGHGCILETTFSEDSGELLGVVSEGLNTYEINGVNYTIELCNNEVNNGLNTVNVFNEEGHVLLSCEGVSEVFIIKGATSTFLKANREVIFTFPNGEAL